MTPAGGDTLATRKPGLTITALDDEVLVYERETMRVSCLNSFAAEVLARCDGTASIAEIARDLPFENVDERVVSLTLRDLLKAGLLVPDSVSGILPPTGPSRRELIRRLGLGTAVAVPAVAAVVLPSPARASSFGAPCRTDADCGGGLFCIDDDNDPCGPMSNGKCCCGGPCPNL